MKKSFKSVLSFVAAVALIGYGLNIFLQPSTPEAPETPVYNIGDHDRHIFEAVNDEILLTVTLTPADADDQTLVWASSAASSVSVTPQSALTAKIKCLADFDGNVTITVTATNGTVDTADDVSATCVCTFYHPITSMTLGLSIDDDFTDAASVAAGGFLSDRIVNNNLQVLPVSSTIGYKLNVTIAPANATYQNFTIEQTNGSDIYGGDDLLMSKGTGNNILNQNDYQLAHLTFTENEDFTPIGVPWELTVSSEDAIHSDTLTIQIGNELGDSSEGSSVSDRVLISSSTNGSLSYASALILADDLDTWLTKVNDYPETAYIGVNHYIYLAIPAMTGYKATDFTKVFSSTYFEFVSQTATELSGQNNMLIFKAIAPTGATPQSITLDMTNYPTAQNLVVPFLLTSPVTGISVDHSTVTF